jgi:excisionase family DNA binding protein
MSPENSAARVPAASLEEALEAMIKKAVTAAIQSLQSSRETVLLTAEELAVRLKVPVSWVYEQSRQGNIPTHRLGKYLRFELTEVLESQKKER